MRTDRNYLSLFCFIFICIACNNSAVPGKQNAGQQSSETDGDTSFTIEKLTSGPKQHWSGYYDKWQVDVSGRYVLAAEVDHFFRSPTPADTLRILLIDLQDGNKSKEIGTSTAWGWQQSCMLQWIPGSGEKVI